MLNCPRDRLRAEPQDLKPQHAFDKPVGLALVHNFFLTDDFLEFEHAPFDMVLDIHGTQPSICHFRIVTFSVPDVEPAHANVKSVHDWPIFRSTTKVQSQPFCACFGIEIVAYGNGEDGFWPKRR
jgi:hypothetical protein